MKVPFREKSMSWLVLYFLHHPLHNGRHDEQDPDIIARCREADGKLTLLKNSPMPAAGRRR